MSRSKSEEWTALRCWPLCYYPLFLALCLATFSLSGQPAARVYRDRLEPHWLPGNTSLWYRVGTGRGRHEFVFVNAERGERRPAFDHARVAAALNILGATNGSAAVRSSSFSLSGDALPLDSLGFEPDGASITFRVNGKGFKCELPGYKLSPWTVSNATPANGLSPGAGPRASRRTGPETRITFHNGSAEPVHLYWLDPDGERCPYGQLRPGETRDQHTFAGHVWLVTAADGKPLAVYEAEEAESEAEITGEARSDQGRRPTPERRRSREARESGTSPDGKWRAIISEFNVRIANLGTAQETPLTRDGTAEDAYSGRMVWSPDSQKLVVLRTRKGDERKVTLVESSPKDQGQPRVITFDYPKPGDRIAVSKPHLFDIAAGCEIPIDDALFRNPWSITELRWAPDSSRFTFLYNERGHQVLRIIAVDTKGKPHAIIDERSSTFIDYSGKKFSEYLDATGEILWMSERDGWNHLYLYDARTGEVKNQVTRGEWVVREVERVDAEKRQVWFRAGGIRPGQDPYFIHYARVNFDGSGLTILTEGNGDHSIRFSPNRRFFVDSWSRVDLPPVNELRRSDTGALVCVLETADASELKSSGWKPPQPFIAKGRDGKTDIYGVIHWPKDDTADPAKAPSFPVVESIYAGPQDSFVPKSFHTTYPQRKLADRGFIVVQIDGTGTCNRSKKFHDVCWKNLADAGLPDRVLWIKAAARQFPQMDVSRVGIYGTSAGGQSALRALLAHGDFYTAAVADSGCHDNRMDKIWWNEQWMGWPIGPHYEEQSNVTQAHKLQGKLLLMVGELDRNVDPASTFQVVNALIKADKDFELLVVPGGGHGVLGTPYGQRRMLEFFESTLAR